MELGKSTHMETQEKNKEQATQKENGKISVHTVIKKKFKCSFYEKGDIEEGLHQI